MDALFARTPPGTAGGRAAAPGAGEASTHRSLVASATKVLLQPPTQTEVIQRALDTFRESTGGPYQALGQTVSAPAYFRMHNGIASTRQTDRDPGTTLRIAAARSGMPGSDLHLFEEGRATPRQLTRLTQALLDMGKLPQGPGALADRIRGMQFDYAVGMDCAGYVQQAFYASRVAGREQYGLAALAYERFDGIESNKRFARVDEANVRAGDLGVLHAPPATAGNLHPVGHRVIVYSHTVVGPEMQAALTQRYGTAVDELLKSGQVHAYEVDSSWGGGRAGASFGGVKRQLWLHSPGTKMWGYTTGVDAAPFVATDKGPYDHRLDGFFRPKNEP